MSKICGVYILTFPNGKKYIGQSVDVYRRFKINDGSNPHLTNALKKYSWNNVKISVFEREIKELDELEDDLIYILKTDDRLFGYNKKEGGSDGRIKSPETLKKLSESHKLYKITDEHRKNLSIACIGDKNGFFGRHHTKEDKIKMSLLKKGKKLSSEHCKKLSEIRRKNCYVVTSPSGEVFETYSLKEFGKRYNIDGSGLYKVVKNKRLSIKGWTVKYKET